MRTVRRFVIPAKGGEIKKLIDEAQNISRVTYRYEFRRRVNDVWVDFRVAKDLWEQGLPETVVLVIAVREPTEVEIKPFKKIWHVDVYAPNTPEEVLAEIRKDFNPCEEWLKRLTRMFTPDNQKGSEVIRRLKKLLAELEEKENGE